MNTKTTRVVAVLLLLLIPALAYAASFTIDLTAGQVATIQWAYARAGGPATSGFATAQLFFADQIKRIINEWDGQKAISDRGDFCTSFLAANTTARNNSCTAIGQPTGCNPCQ